MIRNMISLMTTLLAFFATTAQTNPIMDPDTLETRDKGQFEIQMCRDVNFQNCDYFEVLPRTCYNIGDNSPFNNAISSVDTNPNACFVYADDSCRGEVHSLAGQYPDFVTQMSMEGFNDELSSYLCWSI